MNAGAARGITAPFPLFFTRVCSRSRSQKPPLIHCACCGPHI